MTVDKIGKYQVLQTLGSGAHSTILLIRRAADSRNYALKIVPIGGKEDQKFLEQARHEFRVAEMLTHPNLIKIFALETESDWLFRIRKVLTLVEYVNGKTLDTFGPLSLPHLVQIFVKVAAGLVHMHKQGVWHADLKPNNIMLSRVGEVKVIDYGLAWIRGEKKDRVQGTPEYMAPETAKNKVVNERTEIFNFGATMYRLVTGKLIPQTVPQPGGFPVEAKRWEGQLKPVRDCNPEVPQALADLIHRCLAFEPGRRPARVSELQGALDHIADELVRRPEDQLERMSEER
jgi:eukaryotic-like serine/threonine-protein kinase